MNEDRLMLGPLSVSLLSAREADVQSEEAGDRRLDEQAELRRLVQIGNQIANPLEIAADPEACALDVVELSLDLVAAWRQQLRRYQGRATRQAMSSLKGSL